MRSGVEGLFFFKVFESGECIYNISYNLDTFKYFFVVFFHNSLIKYEFE
jgi:hypothetical protein